MISNGKEKGQLREENYVRERIIEDKACLHSNVVHKNVILIF